MVDSLKEQTDESLSVEKYCRNNANILEKGCVPEIIAGRFCPFTSDFLDRHYRRQLRNDKYHGILVTNLNCAK